MYRCVFHSGTLQSVKKVFFDRLPEVKEAPKTNKSNPSAYKGTLGFDLCSKSKCLRSKLFYTTSVKNQRFLPPSPQGEGSTNRAYSILLFDGLGVL